MSSSVYSLSTLVPTRDQPTVTAMVTTVALLAGQRTRYSQVTGSSPGWALLLSCLVQATYTYVPLKASSIIWYRPRRVISLAGKGTACLVVSNGSLPAGLWLMSLAGWLPRNWDQLRAQRSYQVWDYFKCVNTWLILSYFGYWKTSAIRGFSSNFVNWIPSQWVQYRLQDPCRSRWTPRRFLPSCIPPARGRTCDGWRTAADARWCSWCTAARMCCTDNQHRHQHRYISRHHHHHQLF